MPSIQNPRTLVTTTSTRPDVRFTSVTVVRPYYASGVPDSRRRRPRRIEPAKSCNISKLANPPGSRRLPDASCIAQDDGGSGSNRVSSDCAGKTTILPSWAQPGELHKSPLAASAPTRSKPELSKVLLRTQLHEDSVDELAPQRRRACEGRAGSVIVTVGRRRRPCASDKECDRGACDRR
jgi:hypothetical protein